MNPTRFHQVVLSWQNLTTKKNIIYIQEVLSIKNCGPIKKHIFKEKWYFFLDTWV
jgi:hypothetical protein